MLVCLICSKLSHDIESKLIQAFYHLLQHYLICKTCFHRSVHQFNCNSFSRISLLTKVIPQKYRVHNALSVFCQKMNIRSQDIPKMNLFDTYLQHIDRNNDSAELSTAFSVETEDNSSGYQNRFVDQYDWLKDKIYGNYQQFKSSTIMKNASQSILPFSQKIKKQGTKIGTKLQNWSKQLQSLQKQMPEISSLSIQKMFKMKYSKFIRS